MEIIFRHNFWRIDVNAVCPLMQRIFSFNIMIYLSDAHTITRRYNSCFIILIIILSQRLLRANKKRIFAIFHRLVCITTSRPNVRYICQLHNFCVSVKCQQLISIVTILYASSSKFRRKFRCKLREIVQNTNNFTLNFNWRKRYFKFTNIFNRDCRLPSTFCFSTNLMLYIMSFYAIINIIDIVLGQNFCHTNCPA